MIPWAVTGSVIVQSDIEVSLVKDTRGLGAPLMSFLGIPIRTRVSRKIRSTELPVSMRIRCTSQFAMSRVITKALSWGLLKSLVSSSENEISGQSARFVLFFFATEVTIFLSCCLIPLIESRKSFDPPMITLTIFFGPLGVTGASAVDLWLCTKVLVTWSVLGLTCWFVIHVRLALVNYDWVWTSLTWESFLRRHFDLVIELIVWG